MKAILISIQPQWVKLILNLIKKDEIRKGTTLYKAINKLIAEQGVAPMLIYCTKGNKHECLEYADNPNPNKEGKWVITSGYPYANGKVVARFNATAEEIKQRIGVFWVWGGHPYYTENVSEENLLNRSCLSATELEDYLQGKIGTDIHINDLKIFDEPKEISEFKYYKKFSEIDYMLPIPRKETCERLVALTRAPESWCYVEV